MRRREKEGKYRAVTDWWLVADGMLCGAGSNGNKTNDMTAEIKSQHKTA